MTTAVEDEGPYVLTYYEGAAYNVPVAFITDKHPDGLELIMPYEGKDMTEAYTDAGHSRSAMRMLKKWKDDSVSPEQVREALEIQNKYKKEAESQKRKALWNKMVLSVSVVTVTASVVLYYRRLRM